jgi:hypothetical protein
MTDSAPTQYEAATSAPVCSWSKWFWPRIAMSVFFCLLTVAMCVLWVRSYSHQDGYSFDQVGAQVPVLGSSRGNITALVIGSHSRSIPREGSGWGSYPASRPWLLFEESSAPNSPRYGFPTKWSISSNGFVLPHWMLAITFAVLAAVSWIGQTWRLSLRRFSLRTMLIATMLVAVLLGLMVWAGR